MGHNTFLKRLFSLPLLGVVGVYFLIKAQLELNATPYFATRDAFELVILGMFLVFSQGWLSVRSGWQPLIVPEIPAGHLLNSGRWPLAVIGLGFCTLAAWRGIETEAVLGLVHAILWVVGLTLILLTVMPAPWIRYLVNCIRPQTSPETPQPIAFQTLIPFLKWCLALVGIWICLYIGWRADMRDVHAVRILERWFLGISLVMIGLVPTPAIVGWLRALWRSIRHDWTEWLLVVALFGVGMVVRIAWLESMPHIQAEDEAAFAIQAVDLVDFSKWRDNPFRYGVWHHPMVYHMTLVASIQTLGQTVFAARLPSAILGALTIPAVYLMARRMLNWRIGLVAAIFMITFPVHVHFSRISINQVGDPLFTALTFAFLTHALRTGDKMEFALAGLALGLSQYFYSAARIVPFIMLGYVLLYALFRPGWLRRYGSALVITLVVGGVVAFPVYYSVSQDEERPISPRLDHVAVFRTGDVELATARGDIQDYWEYQFAHAFGAYIHRFDESGFYGAHGSVMGWYGGVPLLIGAALCLRRWWDPRWLILPLWVAGTAILGGVLLVDPPHYPRYISVVPGLAVLVAIGVDYMVELAWGTVSSLGVGRWPLWHDRRLQIGAVLLPVLLIGQLNLVDYVASYAPKRIYYGERTVHLNEVAWHLQDIDLDRYNIYFLSGVEMNLSGSNLVRYQIGVRGEEFLGEPHEANAIPPGEYVFVAAPSRLEDLTQITQATPPGTLRVYNMQQEDKPLVYMYFVRIT
ncbi:MAG: hypothetical protein GYB66_11410 [Chloroflexi bacterium]|nr:hypothetical protein [Chloroflexota bacterium]